MKRCQKIWADPPPLIWTKSKRTAVFFLVKPSLKPFHQTHQNLNYLFRLAKTWSLSSLLNIMITIKPFHHDHLGHHLCLKGNSILHVNGISQQQINKNLMELWDNDNILDNIHAYQRLSNLILKHTRT